MKDVEIYICGYAIKESCVEKKKTLTWWGGVTCTTELNVPLEALVCGIVESLFTGRNKKVTT